MASVADWVDKAEDDWKAAIDLGRRRRDPLPDPVCFHCQQCAEKYLKALLVSKRISPPRVHGLLELLDLCIQQDGSLAVQAPRVDTLNSYAVSIRYPGAAATRAEAKDAVATMRRLRRVMRKKLGL
ncbi:MAG: HEPN domain-containing protein [Planctomycetota bacterium]